MGIENTFTFGMYQVQTVASTLHIKFTLNCTYYVCWVLEAMHAYFIISFNNISYKTMSSRCLHWLLHFDRKICSVLLTGPRKINWNPQMFYALKHSEPFWPNGECIDTSDRLHSPKTKFKLFAKTPDSCTKELFYT